MKIACGITVALVSLISWGCSPAPVHQSPPAQQAITPVTLAPAEMPVPAVNTPHNPPARNDKPMQFWSEPIQGAHAEVIFVRNNTGDIMYYRNLELYECNGLAQPCGLDPQRVTVAPQATVQALIVRTQDSSGFFYKVKLLYGNSYSK